MSSLRISRIGPLARDIKLAHSVFALPFALLATFLAAGGWPGAGRLGLIIVCMFFARTWAMLANRYLDREIDARNPRTQGRALPAGQVRAGELLAATGLSGVMLLLAAAGFGVIDGNWWPLILSPLVLAWLGAYALLKRFTLLCHFFLGGALAISPLAAGVATDPRCLTEPTLWWLAGFVLLWVGGFDILYAMQDIEIDRRQGLHSIPAKLGHDRALWAAGLVHLAALGLLVGTATASPLLRLLFWAGVGLVALLLAFEHAAASAGRFSMAFFTYNGVISLVVGTLGILDAIGG